MLSNNKKLIAVVGATGQQGGGVLRALKGSGQFKVRALTRNPDKHRELAEEVVEADLDRPETLKAAFEGAHGVFLVTNFQEAGTAELKQATAAIRAAFRWTQQGEHLIALFESRDIGTNLFNNTRHVRSRNPRERNWKYLLHEAAANCRVHWIYTGCMNPN